MNKKFWMIFILIFLPVILFAQSVNDFHPLMNKLPIPEEFITPANTRFEEEAKTIDKTEKANIKKDKKQFFLESNYEVDYILKSGKVLFNDDIYKYINKVADKLLEQKPDLQKKLKFYPIKIDVANAFTFNEGYIFINIGLIARLDNEAELAFIIAHEITHYEKKHLIKKHIKLKQLERTSGDLDREDVEYQLKKLSRYSRENEFDADMGALTMLQNSPYNASASVTSLEMLYISDEPVEAIPFDKKFLEAGTLRLPQKFFELPEKQKEKQIDPDDEEEQNYKDSMAGHPAIELRIKAMKKAIDKRGAGGSSLFLTAGKKEFEYIKDVARFEMTQLYSLENNFSEGIYHNFLLQKTNLKNHYLQKNLSILFGKLAIKSTFQSLNTFMLKAEKVESDNAIINQLCYKLNKEEINLIALKLTWLAYKHNKKDEQLKDLINQLGENYKSNFRDNLNDFESYKNFNDSSIESMYGGNPAVPQYDKKGRIKKQKNRGKKYVFEDSFAKFALSDLIKNDTAFVNFFDGLTVEKKGKTVEEEDEAEEEESDQKASKKNKWKSSVNKINPEEAFTTDKILVFEPAYSKTDYTKKLQVNYVGDEKTEANFRSVIEFCAHKAKMKVDLLAANTITGNDIVAFNNYCVLRDWIREISMNKDNLNVPATNADKIKEISKQYGARYLALTYNITKVRKKHRGSGFLTLLGSLGLLVFNPALSLSNIRRGFGAIHQFELAIGIFDLMENRIIYYEIISQNEKNSDDLIKSQLYAFFLKINHPK